MTSTNGKNASTKNTQKGGPIKPEEGRTVRKGRPASLPQKTKQKTGRRTYGARITTVQYNALQRAFFERQSIDHAAEQAGVSWKTAKNYIEGPGRPEVGLVPIHQLWLDVQTEVQEKQQMTLLRFHEQQQKELQDIIDTNLAELRLIRAEVFSRVKKFKESKGTDIDTGTSMTAALRSYERAVKLMERVLGAPDLTLRSSGGEDRYRDWTDQEIMDFMTTGKMPDRAR